MKSTMVLATKVEEQLCLEYPFFSKGYSLPSPKRCLMISKAVLMLAIAMLAIFPVQANVVVYVTYENYKSGRGDSYKDYLSYFHAAGTIKRLTFEGNDGEKIKIYPGDIWGFTYKGATFRINHQAQLMPMRVMNAGKVYYYENGLAHLDMLRKDGGVGAASLGWLYYLSKDLTSFIISLPNKKIFKNEHILKFIKENPESKPLFDCMASKDYLTIESARTCVEEYQGKYLDK